jgi:hypothetical protein
MAWCLLNTQLAVLQYTSTLAYDADHLNIPSLDDITMNPQIVRMLDIIVYLLLIMAAISAGALFVKAITAKEKEIHGGGTLWGIFMIGMVLAVITSRDLYSFLFNLGLIGLGLVAAGTLVFRAATAKTKETHGNSTLWWIFLIGLAVGVWSVVKIGIHK